MLILMEGIVLCFILLVFCVVGIRMKIDRLHKLLTSTQKSYFEINKTGNYHDLTVPGFVIRYSFNIVC